jgi:hypothetical protein
MAKPSRIDRLTRNVTRDVVEHPRDLTEFYATQEKISLAAAALYVLQLEQMVWIARSGPSTHPVFSPGYKRRISKI